MNHLTQYDFNRILQFLQQLNKLTNLSDFTTHLLSILPLVISSDLTYTVGGGNDILAAPLAADDVHLISKVKVSKSHFLQHPVAMQYLITGDGSAKKISDFLPESELYQRESLYGEFLQPLGMLDQMSLVVKDKKSDAQNINRFDSELINISVIRSNFSSVCLEKPLMDLVVVLHRDQRNFSDRDRDILNFINPHILQAYENSQTITRIQQSHGLLNRVLDETNSIIINLDGSIKLMTEQSNKLLRKYFLISDQTRDKLPETITKWLKIKIANLSSDSEFKSPSSYFSISQDNRTLIVRFFVDATNQYYLLTLEEKVPVSLSYSTLKELGLSKRETEIIVWMFRDKSNLEISQILNLSHRTVQKHCENIYSKLDVNNRAAAITKIFQEMAVMQKF